MLKFKSLLCFLVVCLNSYSQTSGVATYQLISNQKIPDSIVLDSNLKKTLNESIKNTNDIIFELKFNDIIAIYKEKKIDKLKTDNEDNELSNKFARILAGINDLTYIDLLNNIVLYQKDIFNDKYLIKRNLNDYNWKIDKNNRVVIDNYVCQTATTTLTKEGRSGKKEILVTAWFTSDINLPYGPNGFGGLPGLIIQIKKGNIVTKLNDLVFKDLDNKINLPDGNPISQKEFDALMKDMALNRRKYFKRN